MRRVVLDVNVLVGAIVFPGVCRKIVASLAEEKFTIVLSPPLLEDLLRVLEKPKLKKLVKPDILEEMISLIHMRAVIVDPKIKVKVCRDPDDDAVIECALAAKANTIVSGDHDLLTMKAYHGISLLSPRAFMSRFKIR